MANTNVKFKRAPQLHFPGKGVRTERLGKMIIHPSVLLDWLQFPKAKIRAIGLDEYFRGIYIILEDKEMPEVREGQEIDIITPSYRSFYEKGRLVKVVRERK